MKHLPCERCGTATLRDGTPYLMNRAPLRFPFLVSCAKCKRPTRVTATQFNALPNLTMAQLDALGVVDALTKDLRSAGHDEREARDLFAAGWNPVDLANVRPLEER